MKPKPILLTAVGAAALLAAAIAPQPLHGQAGAEDPLFTPIITEVAKQQTLIVENQTKIDETLALIAEDLRLARLFAARGGGRGTGK